ncbi:MAG: hypothetical protein WCB14_21290 [Candidatus Acidiferrales bacterium]
MDRILLVLVLLSGAAVGSSTPGGVTRLESQEQCAQEHRGWVAQALKKMETIKPGMTRKALLEVFKTEGGLSTGLQRTYVSKECSYFKVDVEFEVVGRPNRDENGRVTLVEDNRDVIVKISRPYLQFSILD